MSTIAVQKRGPKPKPFDQAALAASDALIEALSKYKAHFTKGQFATAAGVQFASYYGKRPLPDAAIAIIKGMIASISAPADNVVELFPVEAANDEPVVEVDAIPVGEEVDVIADKSLERANAGMAAVCDAELVRGNNIATPWNFTLALLGAALAEIQSGKHKSAVADVRAEYIAHGKSDKYKKLKKLLPFFSFAGIFADKKSISNETFLKSSGMFTVDIDGLYGDITEHKQAICAIPEVIFCFVSPTGNGFKIGIRINPDTVKNDDDFKRVYYQIEAYFLKEGFTIDDACKDVSRKCFASHDPEIYINYDAEVFVISDVAVEIPKSKPKAKPEPKQRTDNNTETIIIERISKMMLGATDGNRHMVRFKAGRLLGGFIAGGLIDEQKATDIISQLSDVIADGGITDQVEGKTIYDGIENGKQSPLYSVYNKQREYTESSQQEPPRHEKPGAGQSAGGDTHNHTLDNEAKYCKVDLLQYVSDTHLLKRMAIQIAAQTNLPVNTVFMMGLSVYASMSCRSFAVLYQNGRSLPIGINLVDEQPPGTGKSWCLSDFQEPFMQIFFKFPQISKGVLLFYRKKAIAKQTRKQTN